MSRIRTLFLVVTMMQVALAAIASPESPGDRSKAETELYVATFRAVIEQRLAHDHREGVAFFLSLSPADSVGPEDKRKFAIRDVPPEILQRLADAGLPVRPGSQAAQPQPKQEVVDSKTLMPGLRVVARRVTWGSEGEALVYCEIYAHGKDAAGQLARLRHQGDEWSVVSVDTKWKS